MTEVFDVVVIVGSLRRGSYSRRLVLPLGVPDVRSALTILKGHEPMPD